MALHPAHGTDLLPVSGATFVRRNLLQSLPSFAQADLELLNMERLLTFALTRSAAVWLLLCVVACGGGGGASNVKQSTSCPAFSPTPATAGSVASAVDAIAAAQMQALNLPSLSISIGKAGTVLYSQGYGYADPKSCRPALASTDFQIGSVTKQFTAAAILQLQNTGQLSIDASIGDLLPDFPFDRRITVRMLLNHTAGLSDYTSFPSATTWASSGVAKQTVLTQIAQASLLFTPGTAYSYSNSNYFVLGAIVEAVTSTSYSDYLTKNVLEAAGLSNTSYTQPSSAAAPSANGTLWDPSFTYSAGALWSNVDDLVTWNAALLSGKIIPPALFTTMVTPPASVPIVGQTSPSIYAMGWILQSAAGHPYVSHDGQTGSYSAFNGIFLDDGFSVSIMTNVAISDSATIEQFAKTLIQSICTSASTAASC
jgi:D-alanyl-D-alanine carboxypeptidase